MVPTADIVVLGHLGRNPFWGETEVVRPPVATTTLVQAGETRILVDPSLPGDMLAARLHERTGLKPAAVDIVFLTSFHPTHRRGLAVFDEAVWLIGQDERSAVAAHLNELLRDEESAPADTIEAELALLGRMEAAPDELAPGVHLFPSPGVTPGLCALLVAGLQTTVIAGDAVLTREHFARGQVGEQAVDADQAREALTEIYEIADIIIPGHDNMIVVSGGM